MTATFGCHGISVAPDEIGRQLGRLDEPGFRSLRVEVVERVERDPRAELLWQTEEPPGFGLPAISAGTWREPDGAIWLGNTLNLSARLDYAGCVAAIAPKGGNTQVVLEALASLVLPLVAQDSGALVLHASSAARDGRATLICAEGGSGKSSLLMALAASGWSAVSEDQCIVDLDPRGSHRIWPGPSWVRLKQGVQPPLLVDAEEPRFAALDKVGWDLSRWIAHEPCAVERIVLLERPGGEAIVWEPVPRDEVIRRLPAHATWIQDPGGFSKLVLPHVVSLALAVPAFRMRLPVSEHWLGNGVDLLTAE